MPRKPNIKWRNSDRVTLSKTVQQFNSKLTRTLKRNPELIDILPDRITVKEIRKSIQTRNDFNRTIKSYKRFLKKDATEVVSNRQGLKTTKWQRNETQYKVNRINQMRRAERKRANVSTEKGTMGTIRENNLKDKNYNFNTVQPQNWDKIVNQIDKMVSENYMHDKYVRYQQNYIKAMFHVMPRDMAATLQEMLYKFTPEQFTQLYYSNPLLGIDYFYSPEDVQTVYDAILEGLWDAGKEMGIDMT